MLCAMLVRANSSAPASRGGRLIGTICAALAVWACGAAEPAQPPDVILITLDTTRADHLGVYGYERPTSPRIDAFAKEAVVYERAWVTSPWTLPSHASMLTGKHPTSHGAHYDAEAGNATITEVLGFVPRGNYRANRLGQDQVTLAELLYARGYATGGFAGGHWLAPEFGLMQGYEKQVTGAATLAGRPGDELNAEVFAWLKAVPPQRPVHILINYFDAHDPYHAVPGQPPMPPLSEPYADPEARRKVDLYDGEIRLMDGFVGELLDLLKRLGRYEDALIIITSDHGELFGEHGEWKHGPFLYEELMRAVMIIRMPGGEGGGRRVWGQASLVDLLPLVADVVGFELPEGVEGTMPGERKLAVAEARPPGVLLRQRGESMDRTLTAGVDWPYKLIESSRGDRDLYNLERDPEEGAPVAGDDDVATHLSTSLDAYRARARPPEQVERARSSSPETEEHLRALGYIE